MVAIYYRMPILVDLLIQRYAISDISDIQNGGYGIIANHLKGNNF